MKQLINNDWWPVLKPQFETANYQQLHNFLVDEYGHQQVYPEMHHIFEAFNWTPFSKVKVVILGQDPYHGPGQAHGCSFSVLPGVAVPPSLQNIYKELQADLGCPPVKHGYLRFWAEQGVLLLNSVLTVRAGQAYSHQGHGWEQLTDAAIVALSERPAPVVFILWGRAARDKKRLIDLKRNFVVESAHPSPLSAYRGFFGSRPFSKTNQFLEMTGQAPINWQLPSTVDHL
ncbi:uracil-DNA glycosylase [Limosilactobacillus fermentum]|uniref:uracil-DNA glycosylase n=1 Tax=Limosilactobacillus fermentum TaxID=1613 RepID=UPI0021A3B81E|nr:uracil-DNA glycosylase [Limosilactobacillus fermentum]MCT3450214.1 uracil-DNA glycosylase [Limosilactobacillus fermentum]MCT3453269.1 uracil-DNA glycosylase [Limosilactobacillus fermentum]MCT3454606.1 uracil-DNA glycosylase [Limosilactobacillus fermentum]MCT3458190.1 uracil-DNA glycosylase [Limosilactobacillus fermentum]MCT3460095.1 uracil-DNA glycosylase [Limosilactobacillus fermentum]